MSTTLTALQAGSVSYCYVAAVEGYKQLLTSGDTAAALTAWAGTDWATSGTCLGGLFVDVQHEQQINPWEPFNSGGRCTFTVVKTTTADTFGVDTHRKGGSDETILSAALDRDDVTVNVKSASLFDASGEIHIGTECIAYTATTASTFTGCTRGKYSPFAADGSETTRFSNDHRVGSDAQSVKLQPVVSSIPRAWNGRRVGIWIHRVVNGVLDVKAQAHLAYAGRIVDIRDDPGSLGTIVECEHALDEVKEGVVGRDLWSCKAKAGVFLESWMEFGMFDENASGTDRTANPLTIVASGASGANEINEGFYTHAELFSKLEAWFVSELAASRIWGTYRISIQDEQDGYRTKFYATLPAGVTGYFAFTMPVGVAKFLGYGITPGVVRQISGGRIELYHFQPGASEEYYPSSGAPLRAVMFTNLYNSAATNKFEFADERGEFFDQEDYWPGAAPVSTVANRGWGIFLIDGKFLARGMFHLTLDQILNVTPLPFQYSGTKADLTPLSTTEYDGTDFIDVKQVLILEAPLWELINLLAYSTGTAGYNHADYDILPSGCGLSIPADLLGLEFEASVAGLPGASNSTVIVLDEPISMADLFGGDFILRRAFTLWKEGHIKFGTWRAPTSGDAVHTLTESNKAEPAGSDSNDKHRSASSQTSEWARSVVKIDYNRDITALEKDGGYRDSITMEDRTAVDDAGGRVKLFTIKARNTYGQYANTGVGVNSLAPGFLSFLPMVSRPAWKIRRSIDCRYFEGLSVGDVVLFSDEFARDPITGARGIALRPAIVTMHKWGIGGAQADSDDPAPVGGEVELFYTDVNPTLQSAPYAPAADVDYSAITAGFDYGYSTSATSLRCFAHHYSQTVDGELDGSPIEIEDAHDASHFVAGHKIKIIERDPLDPTNPIIWERIVSSQSGDDIVLTVALSSPDWDPAKKYRVVFNDYDVIVSAQQAWVFQADDADGLIQDTAQPYLYGSGTPPGAYEANPAQSAQEAVELVPTIVQLEGAPRDVGYEKQMTRLTENIIDYKTTSSPYLFNTVLTNTDYAAGYQLVAATPLYLMWELLSGSTRRELSVAPSFRSSDGTQVYIRISIYRNAPHDTTLNDQSPGTVYDAVVFGTTSTTWQIPDPDVLFAEIKDVFGGCWLQIECSYKCETRGLARLVEGPRSA